MIKRIKEVNEKFFNKTHRKKGGIFHCERRVYARVPNSGICNPARKAWHRTSNSSFLPRWVPGCCFRCFLVGIRYILNDEILLIRDISKYTDAPILGMIHKYKEDIPVSQLVVDKKAQGVDCRGFPHGTYQPAVYL